MQRKALSSLIPMPAPSPPLYKSWYEDTNDEPCSRNAHNEKRHDSYDVDGVEHYWSGPENVKYWTRMAKSGR